MIIVRKITMFNSKVLPPIAPNTYMTRAHLTKKLQQIQHYKLTIVQSDAGFGKSLGLAQYFRGSGRLYAWYSVTEDDDDIIPFISYLQHSIKRILPTFGASLDTVETDPHRFFKEEEIEQWLALFINELCTLEEDIFIVIDDYYLVDHVFMINYLMEKLVRLIPPHVHIVIASRMSVNWSVLPKLTVENQLFMIERSDFIFSQEEMQVYLDDYFGVIIDDETAQDLIELTEGWAIAINLIAINFDQINPTWKGKNKLVFQDLFEYLSEEVFQRKTKAEQTALLHFAIFPTFSETLIADFYGESTVALLRNRLTELGFIQSLEAEKTYRYHALFHQFLQNKWLQTDRQAFVSLHQQAAEYFLSRKKYLQATYHAGQTADDDFIGATLEKTGKHLIELGQFDRYLDVYQSLNEQVKEKHYALYYFEGEVQRYRAFYEKSRQAYVKCQAFAKHHDDYYYLSRTNAGLAHIFLDTIQPSLAEPYLKRAIDLSQHAHHMTNQEIALLKRQFAENLVNLGKAKNAQKWIASEQMERAILETGNLDVRLDLRMGNLQQGVALLKERMVTDSLPDSHRETEVLLSFLYGMLGEGELALHHANEGIKTGQKMKSRFIEAVGYTRFGHAQLLTYPFDLHSVEKFYEKAIDIMDELHVSRGKVEPLMGLSMVMLRQGDSNKALLYGKEALSETEKVSDRWMSSLIYVCLAMTHFYEKSYQQAEADILEAQHLFQVCGDVYGEMITQFWLMNVYQATEKKEKFANASLHFATICVKENYLFYVKKDTLLGPIDRQIIYPLFQEMLACHPYDKAVQHVTRELQIEEELNYASYRIYVRSLKEFQVMLGTQFVEDKMWQREKAKELFLYFLLHRDRFIDRDELLQALWPNHEEKTANQMLKVTLNALLKVLEPNRKARSQSFFIQRKNTMYRLNPMAEVTFDLEYFYHFIDIGLAEEIIEQSNYLLKKAITLYQKNPFDVCKDSHWFAQLEVDLENKHIQALERLASNYLALQEYQSVIYYSKQILQVNSTWEEAYRMLMMAYYHMKNRPQSIKWYNHCVEVLEKELHINPMKETKTLYRTILDG